MIGHRGGGRGLRATEENAVPSNYDEDGLDATGGSNDVGEDTEPIMGELVRHAQDVLGDVRQSASGDTRSASGT